MADHSGQMPSGAFDVTKLWVTEPAAADAPSEAIPRGGEFTLHAIFTGSGTQWNNMKSQQHVFAVNFHVERIGAQPAEEDYGPVNITLNPATDSYTAEYTVAAQQNMLPEGVYRVGCTAQNQNWKGAVGFYEGLVIQIYTP